LYAAARTLVEDEFPATVVPDVLQAVGLDPDVVLATPSSTRGDRRRDAAWPAAILAAWDRQCAFCGFDGQLGGAGVGLEAAHVRWFNFDGPDTLDNGLALCSLHHKLFDRGALGLDQDLRVKSRPSTRPEPASAGCCTTCTTDRYAPDPAREPPHRTTSNGTPARSSRVSRSSLEPGAAKPIPPGFRRVP